MLLMLLVLIVLTTAAALVAWQLRRRHLARWLIPYWCEAPRRTAPGDMDEIHVLICIADHYEPRAYGVDQLRGAARVQRWLHEYPRQFGRFADSDGRPPRHTFFFPAEEYAPEYLEPLTELCRAGYGEVEIHLHHDDDTSHGFRQKLVDFRDLLVERHGLLSHHRATGQVGYAFVHGNWALCNSRPNGEWCGVNDELAILTETGCYADLTYPSAPDATQPPIVNRIYFARDLPGRCRSHETALRIDNGMPPSDALMLIQGPLVLDWRRRKWGLMPRLENACLQPSQPPSIERLDYWLKARVQVPGRPDWFFVKLHAHGATEDAADVLLGESMVQFHEDLALRAQRNSNFHYHYVTAREMYNLARAAMAGFRASVAEALDYELLSNLAASFVPAGERSRS